MGTQPNDPQVRPGAGPAGEGKGAPPEPAEAGPLPGPVLLDPSDAEVDEWAANERQRREAWLSGPTQGERAAWARRERARRRAAFAGEWGTPAPEPARLGLRYLREAQLAAEGAASLLWQWSRRRLDDLVRAGREWEEEIVRTSRRVPLDDEGA